MLQEFQIDNYYDGYRTSEINCIDLPIAAAAGHYHREYYFYYCFCYTYLLNWSRYFKDDWYTTRKEILDVLGLEFCKVKVECLEELEDKIATCFREQTPIVWIVKYGALFYSKYYGYGTYDHGFLISDYNDETKIYGIRDREAVRQHIDAGIFQSDILHRLPLKAEELKMIWKDSQELLKQEESCHVNTFYCIRSYKEKNEVSFFQVLERLIKIGARVERSQLELYLYESIENQLQHRIMEKFEIEKVRRIFYRSFDTMRKVMKRCLSLEVQESHIFNEIQEVLDQMIAIRTELINQLQVYTARNMILEKAKIQPNLILDEHKFEQFKGLLDQLCMLNEHSEEREKE